MRVYGNYCGPNWSDGKVQPSVANGGPAIDELDEICRIHDACYASDGPLKECDIRFAKRMFQYGTPLAVAMGIAVGGQGLMRPSDIQQLSNNKNKNYQQPTMPTKRNSNRRDLRPINVITTPVPTPSMRVVKPTKASNPTQSMPAAYVMNMQTKAPKVRSKNGKTLLAHRGLVSVVTGSTTFNAVKYVCNPGIAASFPWCSRLAKSYDKYKFTKLKFIYKAIAPTTVSGAVMLAFDYDTLDAVPTSKYEASQTFPNAETNVFATTELNVQVDPVWRFVRQGDLSGTDLKTYDFGSLIVSTSYSAAQVVGELYVEYEVELDKPSLGKPISCLIVGTGPRTDMFSTVAKYGSAQPFSNVSPLTGSVSANVLYCLVPGEYHIEAYSIGTVLSNITAAITGLGAVGHPPSSGAAVYNAAQLEMRNLWQVKVSYGDYITFAYTATTATQHSLNISEAEYL